MQTRSRARDKKKKKKKLCLVAEKLREKDSINYYSLNICHELNMRIQSFSSPTFSQEPNRGKDVDMEFSLLRKSPRLNV